MKIKNNVIFEDKPNYSYTWDEIADFILKKQNQYIRKR